MIPEAEAVRFPHSAPVLVTYVFLTGDTSSSGNPKKNAFAVLHQVAADAVRTNDSDRRLSMIV